MPGNTSEASMKRFFHHPATVRALSALISGYMYVVFATCRVRVITSLPEPLTSGPVVLASWHQQIPMVPVMRSRNPSRMLALIASSRAGKVIRMIAAWYGIGAVEGSSRKGGITAVRMLVKSARSGCSLYITPDGSSGPACVAKKGAAAVARLTHLPLIPCAAWPTRGKTLGTWDRFRVPYPFTTIRVAYGEPMPACSSKALGDALNTLTRKVQDAS
jgi:lysophospholipid acyltransferase (LPLAT)-like uncharacterized protein